MPYIDPPQTLPQALIEEARRRTRRRRLAYICVALTALIGGGIAAGFGLTGGGTGTGTSAPPPGFTSVRAHGRVAHAVIDYSSNARITTLAKQDRAARMTEEVWYDARGGLWRDVVRVDGRVRSDRAGTCPVSPKEPHCEWALPLGYLRPWPSASGLHVTGKGTFRGLPVIWLEAKHRVNTPPPSQVTEQVGLDPRTHKLVVERAFADGRLVNETAISQRASLSSGSVSFLVPKSMAGRVPESLYEPFTGRVLAYGIPAARAALGTAPLWLGPRFGGYVLRSVTTGTYPFGTTKTGALRPAKFVRFDYGTRIDENYVVSVEEFGSVRPYFYKQGPRTGSIERDGTSIARMTRAGLLLRVASENPGFQLTQARAIALAKALRPVPKGLKTVPTLRQQ